MRKLPTRCEIVIVGGGVVSLATAFELASRGERVTVLEKKRPGAGASRVAAAMLAPASEAWDEREELIRLGLESLERYPAFVERVERVSGLPCGFRPEPAMWVALDRDHRENLDRLHELHVEMGLASRPITAAEVRSLEPRVSGRAVSGLELGADCRVDSPRLVAALEEGARRLGVAIHERCRVTTISRDDGTLSVSGEADDDEGGAAPFAIVAGRVLLAAGAWSTHEIEHPASGRLEVRPVKGQSVVLRGERLIERIVQTPDVYVVPRGDETVVGASVEEQAFDARPRAGAVRELLKRAFEVLPGVDELEVAGLPVSFRPAVSDHMPVIGPGGAEGFFVATGHYRNGMLLAPVTAHHAANLLQTGRVPDEIVPFTMERWEVSPDRATLRG